MYLGEGQMSCVPHARLADGVQCVISRTTGDGSEERDAV